MELGLPVFVVFDADGDTSNESNRTRHEKDNRALLTLLGAKQDPFPEATIWEANHVVWPTNLTKVVREDFGDKYETYVEPVRLRYAHEADLDKNGLFIASWLTAARAAGVTSPGLTRLCNTILAYAGDAKGSRETPPVAAATQRAGDEAGSLPGESCSTIASPPVGARPKPASPKQVDDMSLWGAPLEVDRRP
jgi:hypothetical protein